MSRYDSITPTKTATAPVEKKGLFGNLFNKQAKIEAPVIEEPVVENQRPNRYLDTLPDKDGNIKAPPVNRYLEAPIKGQPKNETVQPTEPIQATAPVKQTKASKVAGVVFDTYKTVLRKAGERQQKNDEDYLLILNQQRTGFGLPEYKTVDEWKADAPIMKAMNSERGKKIISGIAEGTSNLGLKTFAKGKSYLQDFADPEQPLAGKVLKATNSVLNPLLIPALMADPRSGKNYKKNYEALLAKRNDPTNTKAEKIAYGLQDSLPQTLIGVLLYAGGSYAARNPNGGRALSAPYFGALSANEQLQERGEVDNLGNIAIDVVGDEVLGNSLGALFKKPSKTLLGAFTKGFGTEGGTEVAQTLLKYSNDYKNAKTDEERLAIIEKSKEYVKNGDMLNEFIIGGIAGGTITVGANSIAGGQTEVPVQEISTGPQINAPIAEDQKPEQVNRYLDLIPAETTPAPQDIQTRADNLAGTNIDNKPVENPLTTRLKENVAGTNNEPTNDKADIQKLKNSINEGKTILRAGTRNGVKLTQDEIDQIVRSIDNAQAKIGVENLDGYKMQEISSETIFNSNKSPRPEDLTKEGLRKWKLLVKRGEAVFENGRFSNTKPTNSEGTAKYNKGDKIQVVSKETGSIRATGEITGFSKDGSPIVIDSRTDLPTTFSTEKFNITVDNVVDNENKSVDNENESLAEIAKNYKTAEEFVKAQGASFFHTTPAQFDKFDKKFLGENTNFDNATQGFFFTDSLKQIEEFKNVLQKGFGGGFTIENRTKTAEEISKYRVIEKITKKENFFNLNYGAKDLTAKEARDFAEFADKKMGGLYSFMEGEKVDHKKMTDTELNEFLKEEVFIDDLDPDSSFTPRFTEEYLGDFIKFLENKGYKGLISNFGNGKNEYMIFDPNSLPIKSELEEIWKKANAKKEPTTSILGQKIDTEKVAEAQKDIKIAKDFNFDYKIGDSLYSDGKKYLVKGSYIENGKPVYNVYTPGKKNSNAHNFIIRAKDIDKKTKRPVSKELPRSLQERQLAFDVLKDIQDSSNFKEFNIWKYADKRNDTLPEVTGKGKSKFSRKGDDILSEAGYEDSEEGRQAFEKWRANDIYLKQEEKDLKQAIKDFKEGKYVEPKVEKKPELPVYDTASDLPFSIGKYADGTPIEMGNLDKVKPIEFPELVDLARELTGNVPFIKRLSETKNGFFRSKDASVTLNSEIFKDPEQVAKTLAHEIGHLIDYLPDGTLARGNLIGRLKTLHSFMAETFGTEGEKFSDTRKSQIRNEVTKQILNENGLKIGDLFGNKLSKQENAKIKEEIRAEMKARMDSVLESEGYIKNSEIKKELKAVTEFWRPYDTQKSSDKYKKYRNSSKELYADAISVLFNTPGTLEKMAPTFYKEFFNALDRKPAVFNAYFDLQSLLGGDRSTIVQRRREGVRKMFDEGDYKASELQRIREEEKKSRENNLLFQFKFDVIDKNFAFIDRLNQLKKQGVQINEDENPLYYLEERNYLGGKIKAIMETDFNPVYQNLQENGISWTDFGEALFYERIGSGDRSDVANPRGITPEASKELLNSLYEQLGTEKTKILKDNLDTFRAGMRNVSEEAYKEGLYSAEMYENMLANPSYATFQVIDHIDKTMTSKIHKSLGTLKDITNPANATLLKTIATIRAIEQNKVKRAGLEFLQKNFSEEIKPAKTIFQGKGRVAIKSQMPNEELVTYMEDGKQKGFYVDPYIAKSLMNESIEKNNVIVSGLKMLNSTVFRPLFITYNPGFQAFNFLRDFERFWKNQPNMTLLRSMKLYKQAFQASKIRAFGGGENTEAGKLIAQMEREQILSITYSDLSDGMNSEEKQIDTILRKSGIYEKQEPKYKAMKPILNFLDFIKDTGDLIETLPKVAGYLDATANNTKPITKAQASFIRKNIGSPDFLAGGYWKPISNEIFLFSNSITQGIRSDVNVATDPATRSGYWWKTVKKDVVPKIIMFAAMAGLFGDELKELFEDVSEYDMTNFLIIPLGRDENGKTIYFRVPQDEGGRLIGGLTWKLISSQNNRQPFFKDMANVLSFTGGQIPSISPAISNTGAVASFLAGNNPYDSFRGRNVLTDDQYKAGGKYALKPFLGWLFQQSGGNVFMKLYNEGIAPKEKSPTEKIFNAPIVGNIAGRFLKVSNYGATEKLRAITNEVQSDQAKTRIDENSIIANYVRKAQETNATSFKDIYALQKEMLAEVKAMDPNEKPSQEHLGNLATKFRVSLQKSKGSPEINALLASPTNEEKITLLKEIKESMTESEYAEFKKTLTANKVVSGEVIFKAEK